MTSMHPTPIKRKNGRGNRSTGTLGDYLLLISRGWTVEEVGKRFGVGHGAVRKAMLKHGLPTCARTYLRWINATPADSLAEKEVRA